MDDLNNLEEELKQKEDKKRRGQKISGRSVFRLQEIIKEKEKKIKIQEEDDK
ncbi:MAG: hypothetical protein US31_C0013G0007 [Berkelbacteria bacterium GW2011_GWA1_36_9]|uniref:Uncharacterized protein n=1 Tax=Berkelbacteria bacterium GW2011_GWA1_36_9 TaxID=1618331 RepID=A0A0G0I0Y7_9BACT|nr:MAG: hypothetical protein US31_C0013G0007 [Berkelbacteria bacterium GW2011_GWA1_36_9]